MAVNVVAGCGGSETERVPRKPFVSPLRAKGAQPARAGLRRGYFGTENVVSGHEAAHSASPSHLG